MLSFARTLLLGRLRSGGLVVVLLAACAHALVLIAGDARADDELARQHFKRGVELYDKKKYAEALGAFQDAYKEKPSAGIKQNIALCLKGLNRPAEAAAAFDEALEEGKTTLKPETRAAIERELAELSKVVATVIFKIVTEGGKPVEPVRISVTTVGDSSGVARPLPAGAHTRPLRLMPGMYLFTVEAPGYPPPGAKKLALVSGAPVDVTFVLRQGEQGKLTVKPTVEDAVVRVDGVEVGRGEWSGEVPAGQHRIEVSAPGWKTTTADVSVPAGGAVEYPIKLQAYTEAPPAYAPPTYQPKKPKKSYVVPMLGVQTTSYRLGVPLGEPPTHGTRRDLGGGSIGGRIGFFFDKTLALEGIAEAASVDASYRLRPTDATDSRTRIVSWQLAPMLRLTLPRERKVRFTAATGLGLQGRFVETTFAGSDAPLMKKGSGVGWTWLFDAGAQFELAPVFLETALFFDVHSVKSVRDDDASAARLLYSSPATRIGLRFGVGIPF